MTVKIIAEAGVNHNGDIGLAKELVEAAAKAKADIVKFQTFKADKLVTRTAEKAQYQKNNCNTDESQYEMLKKLELNADMHFEIIDCCKKNNIQFLSTAFDHDSLEFLTRIIDLKQLKIPSGDLTNAPLLLAHARTGCDLIVSTGMATLGEVELALGVIAFGLVSPPLSKPSLSAFNEAYFSKDGQKKLRDKVTLLHCTSDYPAPVEEVNLRAMSSLSGSFKLKVGYSDHTLGIIVPVAAVACGAQVIEKHFTLDRNMEGPDHKASLEPDELKDMVEAIKVVEKVMGDGIKMPQASELDTMRVARKSLVVVKAIKKGEKFSEENIAVLRPGTGLSPFQYWETIGKAATRNLKSGEVLT